MRFSAFFYSLIFLAGPASAGTLMISSDSARHGKLAAIPEFLITELQKAGAQPEGGSAAARDKLLSLRIHKLDCRSYQDSHGEQASCKFDVEDERGHSRKVRYGNAQAMMNALRELNYATDSIEIVECDSNDDCRARVSAILCMENQGLKAGTPGRANCSFSD